MENFIQNFLILKITRIFQKKREMWNVDTMKRKILFKKILIKRRKKNLVDKEKLVLNLKADENLITRDSPPKNSKT